MKRGETREGRYRSRLSCLVPARGSTIQGRTEIDAESNGYRVKETDREGGEMLGTFHGGLGDWLLSSFRCVECVRLDLPLL